jgi:hypothetical protein
MKLQYLVFGSILSTFALAGSIWEHPIPSANTHELSRKRQSANPTKYSVKEPPLTTPWTYEVGTNPWSEYPRPQLQRSRWKNLNGIWTYQNVSGLDAVRSPPINQTLQNEVLIPSCLESGLSGKQLILQSSSALLTSRQEFKAITLYILGFRLLLLCHQIGSNSGFF